MPDEPNDYEGWISPDELKDKYVLKERAETDIKRRIKSAATNAAEKARAALMEDEEFLASLREPEPKGDKVDIDAEKKKWTKDYDAKKLQPLAEDRDEWRTVAVHQAIAHEAIRQGIKPAFAGTDPHKPSIVFALRDEVGFDRERGKFVMLDNGQVSSKTLTEYLTELKESDEWKVYFSDEKITGGSGYTGSTNGNTPPGSYTEMSIHDKAKMYREDPGKFAATATAQKK